jgi:REP element-mobilizing transposase RayT
MKQLALDLRTWGGKRKGAGRPPNGDKAGVSHLRRERFPSRHPVHVTMRMLRQVGFLRSGRRYRAIENALRMARELHGVRIIHFSVQGNHLHLLVEADDAESLTRAMQSLAVRLAIALNRAAGRHGKVFADRYHSRSLATRREVANALNYVLKNFLHHLREDVAPQGFDPCSSAAWLVVHLPPEAPVVAPQTWLLRRAAADVGPPR